MLMVIVNAGRYLNTTTVLADGKVLVAGGANGRFPVNSAEIYEPTANAWTLTGNMASGRRMRGVAGGRRFFEQRLENDAQKSFVFESRVSRAGRRADHSFTVDYDQLRNFQLLSSLPAQIGVDAFGCGVAERIGKL